MHNRRWFTGLLALGLLLLLAAPALAAKTYTTRVEGQRNGGMRPDMSVPYLTTGHTAFMNGYVAPRVYSSPIVDDPVNPGARPVYNLPFYGGVMGFGDKSNGAVPRQTRLTPR